MDNFGFIEYQPLSCKLATYAKNMLHISRGGASAPPPCPCLRVPMMQMPLAPVLQLLKVVAAPHTTHTPLRSWAWVRIKWVRKVAFVSAKGTSLRASASFEPFCMKIGWGLQSRDRKKSQKIMRGSHRKDMLPLTQCWNYSSACDKLWLTDYNNNVRHKSSNISKNTRLTPCCTTLLPFVLDWRSIATTQTFSTPAFSVARFWQNHFK